MDSEMEVPDSTCPTTEAIIAPTIENAAPVTDGGETTVIVNLMETDSTSAAPPSISSTVEGDSAAVESAANVTSISSKYPKLNLRVNEFGIYELVPEEESTAEKPIEATPMADAVSAPETKESVTSEPITTTATSDTEAISQPSKPAVETTAANVVTNNNGSSTTSSNNNGDRERWKQRFPSTTKEKVDIVCCKQCDGYGIADEFVDQNFCSEKCRKLGLSQPTKTKAAGKVAVKRKSTSSNSSSQAGDAASSAVVESSLETCNEQNIKDESKQAKTPSAWSWSKYLERRRAQAAPERLFSDPFPYGKHGFRSGMKLEGIDPEHQSLFCVMTVAEIQGYRLRLHFDGYSDSHDFWLNADSENLFHCGWCEKNGQKLRPPKHYDLAPSQSTSSPLPPNQQQGSSQALTHGRTFSWPQYLKFTSSAAAPRHLFISAQNESPVPSAFRVKMKLEAVDRRHSSHTLCVATVANVIGSRFLVHFDGWDSIYDYWADPSCPYVHPVGWAQEHNTTLTPPCDYEADASDFVWDHYLAKTGATAVPPRAFKPRSPVGFKTGMKLECVDPRNPQLIRVATVAAVKGYRLKIHFDGWSSEYDFWTDDDWPDLHPPGWCLKTGHPLQPPFVSSNGPVSDEGECATPGCTGVGHIEGARYATHISTDHCPYSNANLHRENPAFPDRLTGEEIDPVVQRSASPAAAVASAEEQPVKEEPSKSGKTKAVNIKVEPGDSSSNATPTTEASSPPPQPSSNAIKMEKSKASPSIDLPVKSESEAELNNRLIQVDLRPESPPLEQQYDSLEALTPPPPKKMRISFFSGKTAASEVVRRKSAAIEERGNGDVTNDQSLPVAERKQQEESSRNSLGGPNDQLDVSMSASVPTKKSVHSGYSMMNFPANSNLTTPMCWSKHAALLGDVVGIDTSNQVTRWSCDQVMDFLAKFGVNKTMLEKFKQEEIDGEALLFLSQSDLTDLLGVKLGPAIKIRNALLLMKEKAKSAMPANESHS